MPLIVPEFAGTTTIVHEVRHRVVLDERQIHAILSNVVAQAKGVELGAPHATQAEVRLEKVDAVGSAGFAFRATIVLTENKGPGI